MRLPYTVQCQVFAYSQPCLLLLQAFAASDNSSSSSSSSSGGTLSSSAFVTTILNETSLDILCPIIPSGGSRPATVVFPGASSWVEAAQGLGGQIAQHSSKYLLQKCLRWQLTASNCLTQALCLL